MERFGEPRCYPDLDGRSVFQCEHFFLYFLFLVNGYVLFVYLFIYVFVVSYDSTLALWGIFLTDARAHVCVCVGGMIQKLSYVVGDAAAPPPVWTVPLLGLLGMAT